MAGGSRPAGGTGQTGSHCAPRASALTHPSCTFRPCHGALSWAHSWGPRLLGRPQEAEDSMKNEVQWLSPLALRKELYRGAGLPGPQPLLAPKHPSAYFGPFLDALETPG